VDPRDTVVTPEAVALVVDTAGLGSRMIALLVDSAIQAAVVIALAIIFANTGQSTVAGVFLVITVFLIVWGYFPFFEILWSGRTPGKRTQHLRVIRTDGQPAGAGPILVRNLIRIADFLPGFYAIGSIAILLTRRHQRLGDLAAATMVVRERAAPEPAPLDVGFAVDRRVDTAGITQRDYVVVRDFLQRRTSFEPSARAALARDIATPLRDKVGDDYSTHDEAFLEALAVSFRQRFAEGP
jgi:uncharacterized RDD family membrane protein YckC